MTSLPFQAQNICSRRSWDTDAASHGLWDPFPTLTLKGWAVATPLLRTTLAISPHGSRGSNARAPWEGVGLSARSQKHKASSWRSSLLRAKITQGGSGWRLAAHDRDWIKERADMPLSWDVVH